MEKVLGQRLEVTAGVRIVNAHGNAAVAAHEADLGRAPRTCTRSIRLTSAFEHLRGFPTGRM